MRFISLIMINKSFDSSAKLRNLDGKIFSELKIHHFDTPYRCFLYHDLVAFVEEKTWWWEEAVNDHAKRTAFYAD